MAGLRILHADQSDAVPHLTETGFFDGESTLTTPSSIQRTGCGFALCPLQKFVLGSAVQGCPDQLKCTRQLVSARLAGRVQGVSAALFALCRSLFWPKFVWGSLVQVPKEWLGTRCAKSPNKSLVPSVAPGDDRPGFEGSWSNYPYFPSGTVVATSMERGLFVLDPADAKKQQ